MAEKNRSFDVVGLEDRDGDPISAVAQSHNDLKNESGLPILFKRTGDRAIFEYHLVERSLDNPGRLESFCKDIEKIIADHVKNLKKEVKKKTKISVKFKEIKDLKDYSFEKISLNDRWYLRLWRVYEVSPSAMDEED